MSPTAVSIHLRTKTTSLKIHLGFDEHMSMYHRHPSRCPLRGSQYRHSDSFFFFWILLSLLFLFVEDNSKEFDIVENSRSGCSPFVVIIIAYLYLVSLILITVYTPITTFLMSLCCKYTNEEFNSAILFCTQYFVIHLNNDLCGYYISLGNKRRDIVEFCFLKPSTVATVVIDQSAGTHKM